MKGRLLENRYRIDEELGRGGASVVYKAKDEDSGKTLAVKVLLPEPVGAKEENKPTILARFKREYLACARLDHPNVIKVHHFGVLDDGSRFIVMDYLPHPNLDDFIDDNGPLSLVQAMDLGKQLARALGYCHKEGIIHRDLKPANILVANDGKVTVLDFGMAKDIDAKTLTKTGEIFGTPMYMAPEQIRGHRATELTDIYQVGLILYEALSGRPAFKASKLSELIKMIVDGDVPPLSARAPQATPAWSALVHRCMTPSPERRCPDALSLLRDLETLDRNTPIASAKMKARPETPVKRTAAAKPIKLKDSEETLPLAGARARGKGVGAIAGAFFLGCLLALFVSYAYSAFTFEEIKYSARELKVEKGLGYFEVSWQSQRPYPSLILLAHSGGRSISGNGGKATTNHRVRVSGLAEGKSYRFFISYPSGEKSFEEKVTIPSFEFQLKKAKLKKEQLELSWSSALAQEAELKLLEATGARGGELVERSYKAEKKGQNFSVKFPFHGRSVRGMQVFCKLTDGSTRKTNLAAQLLALIDRFEGVFANNPPDRLASSCFEKISREMKLNPQVKGDWHRYNNELIKRLKDLGIKSLYERATALSTLVFSTGLFTLQERERMYRSIVTVQQLAVWCPTVIGVRVFTWRNEHNLEDFALTLKSTMKDIDQSISLRDKTSSRLHLTTTPTRSNQAKNWKKSFVIKNASNVAAAEIQLRTGVLASMTFQLIVNNQRPYLYVYDRDTFMMKKYSQFMAKAPMSKKPLDIAGVLVEATAVKVLYQRIPPSLLREGNNTIELRAAPISTNGMSWFQGAMMEVDLLLSRF